MDTAENFLKKCVLLDIETGKDNRIFHIGAVYGQKTFEKKGSFDINPALTALDRFCSDAGYIVGHNIISHDLPILAGENPQLKFLLKPVVDTLFLSPLAFPENPYHRLIKDYKLVKSSINNPVADAKLSGKIFRDQFESFRSIVKSQPELTSFYRFCFETSEIENAYGNGMGMAEVLSLVGAPRLNDVHKAMDVFRTITKNKICDDGFRKLSTQFSGSTDCRLHMAYILSWLTVSGGNSVLPPWVRLRFENIVPALKLLRDAPCNSPDCSWCADTHSPQHQLQNYFGYDNFRSLPDGRPLQYEITRCGLQDEPLLGILPTGGGKSICYQLPALVRYHRRGLLTIIISPLQALMKDQVDNLKQRINSDAVAAIYGMLTPIERGEILEQVRLGEIGLLYISPEQLRNHSVIQAIQYRETGCWVFDEAHCLSKWGHDFRPDYLYAARFIKEFSFKNKQALPPVACYTATAKKDVIDEIIDHFKEKLNQKLNLFEGGIERDNLLFEVQTVNAHEKFSRICSLLEEYIGNPSTGSAIIYCSKQSTTEETAKAIALHGWTVEAFHGGLKSPEKRSIQDAFIRGDIPVITATNAFGMGIDKENVRLVIHADIPGSLENYLQEAGRAGRDRKEAKCILLFEENDIEIQFGLNARSALSIRDITQILRNLKSARHNDEGEVIITSGELLRSGHSPPSFDGADDMADTKVKTAVSWLERAGFIERNNNRTSVFQGKPKLTSAEETSKKLSSLNLPHKTRRIWETILTLLINSDPDDGMSTDDIAEALGRNGFADARETRDTRALLSVLHQMAEAGLIMKGILMTAYVQPGGQNSSRRILQRKCEIEKAMIGILIDEHPDNTTDQWLALSLRRLNQRLLDMDYQDSSPELLRSLLSSLARDGKGFGRSRGSIEFRHSFQDNYQVKLKREWQEITEIMKRRHNLSNAILNVLYDKASTLDHKLKNVLVEFSSDDLSDAIKKDIALSVEDSKILAAIDRGLLFLHEQKAIILQKGLSVFRQAMTIKVFPEARKRRYTKGDFEPLSHHYNQRTFQVHVMNEFAVKGADKIKQALGFVMAYFSMDRESFVKKFFSDRKKLLEWATSEKSYKQIVDALNNPKQEAIVAGSMNKNALILAGPGSGKTRVVVHRCAWLLRVKRVPPASILILSFNHSAAVTLRKRLYNLVGNDAKGVAVMTYHGLAMRLTGRSFSENHSLKSAEPSRINNEFDKIITDAIALLNGEKELIGFEQDIIRDRLLEGYQYILVDEYQDIDHRQYQLISAISGKTTGDSDKKLNILAVGDDDQSIYAFRHANVKYIRQFKDDYNASVHHLVENYRSTEQIILGANSLIHHNRDRMKHSTPICINASRKTDPKGGPLEQTDPVSRGCIQIINVNSPIDQAYAVTVEINRLMALNPELAYTDIAVFARNGMQFEELSILRSLFEAEEIPFSYPLEKDSSFGFTRIDEFIRITDWLGDHKNAMIRPSQIIEDYFKDNEAATNPWNRQLYELMESLKSETGDSSIFANNIIDYLYEAATAQRREQRLGAGVFLSTAHGAKGLEFKYVFILDGAWTSKGGQSLEEERRLFYVAMTRAEELLCLISRKDSHNPHIPLIDPSQTVIRNPSANTTPHAPTKTAILGMKQLFLDYAGRMIEGSKQHQALHLLSTGAKLTARVENNTVSLYAQDNTCVARLSQTAAETWKNRVHKITKIKVIAMIIRKKEDVQPEFLSKIKCNTWRIPIVEIKYTL